MTLIEMLIVLAIIGVIAGMTVLGFGMNAPARSVEAEARRLGSRIQLAADGVMIDEIATALEGQDNGYSFLRQAPDGWIPSDEKPFEPHELPEGITLEGAAKHRFPLGPDGSGAPFAVTVAGKKDRWSVAYDGLSVRVDPVPAS